MDFYLWLYTDVSSSNKILILLLQSVELLN